MLAEAATKSAVASSGPEGSRHDGGRAERTGREAGPRSEACGNQAMDGRNAGGHDARTAEKACGILRPVAASWA